jgi:hypothetical protein
MMLVLVGAGLAIRDEWNRALDVRLGILHGGRVTTPLGFREAFRDGRSSSCLTRGRDAGTLDKV